MSTRKTAFRVIVQNYIGERMENNEGVSMKSKLENIVTDFNNASDPNASKFDNFVHLLEGGTVNLNTPIANHEIEEDYYGWFEDAGFERRVIRDDKINHYYYSFLFREFQELCNDFKVKF